MPKDRGKTVKGHVSNLLGKLHLSGRTQAAIYAWPPGLCVKSKRMPATKGEAESLTGVRSD